MIRNLPIGINWRILRATIRHRLRRAAEALDGWLSTEINAGE